MINGFGLNFTVVYSGSEAASNKAIQAAIDQKKPILAYYYTPNWFSAKVDLVHIELPAWTAGLRQGREAKSSSATTRRTTSTRSCRRSSRRAAARRSPLITKFNWTNDDQNLVAAYITDRDSMSDDDAAAKKWLDANPDKWKAWLP